jgi:hypothetical protein
MIAAWPRSLHREGRYQLYFGLLLHGVGPMLAPTAATVFLKILAPMRISEIASSSGTPDSGFRHGRWGGRALTGLVDAVDPQLRPGCGLAG